MRLPLSPLAGLLLGTCLLAAPPAPARAAGWSPALAATIRATLHAFNDAGCARIYALTALWTRSSQSPATTSAACRNGFIANKDDGVTVLRLTLAGPGRYLPPHGHAYRQPVALHEGMAGQPVHSVHEVIQFIRFDGRWYVLAMW